MVHPNPQQTLPINQIQPNPLQPRSDFSKDALEELKLSILEHGIIEPLVIAQTPAGYQIIAGERRWRAAKLAGLTEVPVIIRKTTPRGMLEMALIENVQRTDLTPLERAKAFQRLMSEFRLTNTEIAKRIGKSGPFVSNTVRLLTLPDAIKDGLLGGLITEGHARALAAIDDVRNMVDAYKVILRENGSVRRAEQLARQFKEKQLPTLKMGKVKIKPTLEKELEEWRTRLEKTLGRHASVKLSRSVRQTKVYITLKGDPYRTQQTLEKILKLAE